jgi:hypothetical protein
MGDKIKRVPQKKKSDRQSKRKKRVAKYHREEREDPSEKHTSSNPTFFFQVFTGRQVCLHLRWYRHVGGGVAHQKSLKKSHSCCPCLSNSNPHCENTHTNSVLLRPLGKNPTQPNREFKCKNTKKNNNSGGSQGSC